MEGFAVIAGYELTHHIESIELFQLCRFDKVFGMFVSQSGKVRRMDLIITPHEEYPFCLLGWTGSKQYLRFLRQHAGNCHMYLNSHRQACNKRTCLLRLSSCAGTGSADAQLTPMS